MVTITASVVVTEASAAALGPQGGVGVPLLRWVYEQVTPFGEFWVLL